MLKRLRSLERWIRDKHFETWLPSYTRQSLSRWFSPAPQVQGPRHLIFALCDHYEPMWGGDVPDHISDARVKAWEDRYPKMAGEFHDADGKHPQYSFFFPGEDYQPHFLERLARLVEGDWGEVELHLHHDNDTEESLRALLMTSLDQFASHGHISRGDDGSYQYAFIHGNWCLANSRNDGRYCGVDAELPLLFDTGCYADFTFPAAPSECQPNIVNQIYWPTGDISQRRAYEQGERAKVGKSYDDRLLMIQGPLALSFRKHKVPFRIEGSHLTATDPPSLARVQRWVQQNIHVEGRPEWVFVKVHTHGAPEDVAESLLGDGGRALHQALTTQYNDGSSWVLHYTTAREMFNIARAAMDGKTGNPNDYRDFIIPPPPLKQAKS